MAVLTADKTRISSGDGHGIEVPVAASTEIFLGSIVALDASGYAIPATDTAALAIGGIATAHVDNSAGANGDLTIVLQRGHVERLNHSALVQADLFKNVVVSDDNVVTDAAAATNDLKVGTLVALPSSGVADVLIGVFADVSA